MKWVHPLQVDKIHFCIENHYSTLCYCNECHFYLDMPNINILGIFLYGETTSND